MNVSKQHREDLLKKIQQIRTYIASAQQDENTGNLLQYLDELTKDVKGKKYGLVFEQHKEKIDETLETHTPVLTEQKDLFIDNGGEMNFLIEGDNLAALKLLEKTHKGKIDVIYIDPPYNTGNKDFVYDDNFVDSNDTFRHSKWLSFMEKRLCIAKELLSSKGVIFISIDDNEQATLKFLCDSIFGDKNFVSNVIWQKKTGSSDAVGIATITEYVLVYTKKEDSISKVFSKNKNSFDEKRYKYKDEYFEERGPYYTDSLDRGTLGYYESLDYEIKSPKGTPIYPNGRTTQFNDGWRWKWSKEKFEWGLKNGFIEISPSKKNNGWQVKYKIYLNVDNDGNTIERSAPHKNLINDVLNANAAADIKSIFGSMTFMYSKPQALIKTIINYTKSSSSTILDFFAGSGTTGHAVMKLNAEDGGKRKFILCTNNENNICRDVTYERLKTVITGKRKDGSEYSEKYDASLKYYKIDFVKIDDKMYYEYADDLLKHVRELVELENGINFNGNAEIAIVLTDEEMENFVADGRKDAARRVSILYRGHDVLMTDEQETFLKENGIRVNVIPDYYYNELNR